MNSNQVIKIVLSGLHNVNSENNPNLGGTILNKVSVVMPAYNAARFISYSIVSVLTQTYSNIELVIVNDGSTDNTVEVIESFKNKYPDKIIFINKPVNEGTVKAINRAFEEATGDYLCWLSADDMYFETMVESQLNYLLDNPEMDVCFSKHILIDENNKFLGNDYITDELANEILNNKSWIYNQMLFVGNAFHGCSVFGKREKFVETGGFDPQYKYAHDYDYWLRLASVSNIGFVNEYNVMGRIHEAQVSNQGHNLEDEMRVFFGLLANRPMFEKLMIKAGVDPDMFVRTVHECF